MVIFIKFIYKQNSLFVTVTFKKKKKNWFGILHSTSCLVALATTTANTIKKKNNNCMLEIIKYLWIHQTNMFKILIILILEIYVS